ncbi:hypothetical protein ACFSTC_26265 [Nonomuraea ferruginea]
MGGGRGVGVALLTAMLVVVTAARLFRPVAGAAVGRAHRRPHRRSPAGRLRGRAAARGGAAHDRVRRAGAGVPAGAARGGTARTRCC